MSRTQSIPRGSWAEYARSFTQQHEGWLVTLERSNGRGPHVVAHELPLQSVRVDRRDDAEIIEIAVGQSAQDMSLHHLQDVRDIRVISADTNPNAIERMEIEAEGGTMTLRFRTTIAPELVDGVVP